MGLMDRLIANGGYTVTSLADGSFAVGIKSIEYNVRLNLTFDGGASITYAGYDKGLNMLLDTACIVILEILQVSREKWEIFRVDSIGGENGCAEMRIARVGNSSINNILDRGRLSA